MNGIPNNFLRLRWYQNLRNFLCSPRSVNRPSRSGQSWTPLWAVVLNSFRTSLGQQLKEETRKLGSMAKVIRTSIIRGLPLKCNVDFIRPQYFCNSLQFFQRWLQIILWNYLTENSLELFHLDNQLNWSLIYCKFIFTVRNVFVMCVGTSTNPFLFLIKSKYSGT